MKAIMFALGIFLLAFGQARASSNLRGEADAKGPTIFQKEGAEERKAVSLTDLFQCYGELLPYIKGDRDHRIAPNNHDKLWREIKDTDPINLVASGWRKVKGKRSFEFGLYVLQNDEKDSGKLKLTFYKLPSRRHRSVYNQRGGIIHDVNIPDEDTRDRDLYCLSVPIVGKNGRIRRRAVTFGGYRTEPGQFSSMSIKCNWDCTCGSENRRKYNPLEPNNPYELKNGRKLSLTDPEAKKTLMGTFVNYLNFQRELHIYRGVGENDSADPKYHFPSRSRAVRDCLGKFPKKGKLAEAIDRVAENPILAGYRHSKRSAAATRDH